MATDPQKNKDLDQEGEEIAGGTNLTDDQLKRLAAAGGNVKTALETDLKRLDLTKIAGGRVGPSDEEARRRVNR